MLIARSFCENNSTIISLCCIHYRSKLTTFCTVYSGYTVRVKFMDVSPLLTLLIFFLLWFTLSTSANDELVRAPKILQHKGYDCSTCELLLHSIFTYINLYLELFRYCDRAAGVSRDAAFRIILLYNNSYWNNSDNFSNRVAKQWLKRPHFLMQTFMFSYW